MTDKRPYFVTSNEIRKYNCPSSGLSQLVHQLSGSVTSIESPHVMTPDNALGAAAYNIYLSVSNLLCYSRLLTIIMSMSEHCKKNIGHLQHMGLVNKMS